jgi:hypothetical protein
MVGSAVKTTEASNAVRKEQRQRLGNTAQNLHGLRDWEMTVSCDTVVCPERSFLQSLLWSVPIVSMGYDSYVDVQRMRHDGMKILTILTHVAQLQAKQNH